MKFGELVAAGEGLGDLHHHIPETMDLHRFFNPARNTVLYQVAGLIEPGDVQYHEIRTLFHHFHRRGLVKGGEDLACLVHNEKGGRRLDKEFIDPGERVFSTVPAALPRTLVALL